LYRDNVHWKVLSLLFWYRDNVHWKVLSILNIIPIPKQKRKDHSLEGPFSSVLI
jgi:hypothetical protein